MEKITFNEMFDIFYKHNEENGIKTQFSDPNRLGGVIVYTKDSFDKEYPLESRSYRVASDNKYFVPHLGGNSLFGNCLDGSENCVRLDWYFSAWKIDYCYIETYD